MSCALGPLCKDGTLVENMDTKTKEKLTRTLTGKPCACTTVFVTRIVIYHNGYGSFYPGGGRGGIYSAYFRVVVIVCNPDPVLVYKCRFSFLSTTLTATLFSEN